MKQLAVLFLLIFNLHYLIAQKPAIDSSVFGKWTSLGQPLISDDGNYVLYTIYNYPVTRRNHSLMLQSANGIWKREFNSASNATFSSDSRFVVFMTGNDTLSILDLADKSISHIPNVQSYKLQKCGKDIFLAYQLVSPENSLVLRNISNSVEQSYTSIHEYGFSGEGSNMVFIKNATNEKSEFRELYWMQLGEGKMESTCIWRGNKINNYTFAANGNQLAFISEEKTGNGIAYKLWYYSSGMDTASLMVNERIPGIDPKFTLSPIRPEFNDNGSQIYFKLKLANLHIPNPEAVKVDIWSYRDTQLQSLQNRELENTDFFYGALINIPERKIVRLEQDNERVFSLSNDYVLIRHELGNEGMYESNWNKAAQFSFYLLSAKDGSRKLLKENVVNNLGTLALSPKGKWVLFYDFEKKNYYSYEIRTGKVRNITKKIETTWTRTENETFESSLTWVPWQKTWLADDEAVLIYDNYDIWQVDPSGLKSPVNITNGYGKLNKIKFQLVEEINALSKMSLSSNPGVLLAAFNLANKKNGFYYKKVGLSGDPKLLTMGPYIYYLPDLVHNYYHLPLKAKNANVYLVQRMSTKEAPNYFVTKDFKDFISLSGINPQNEYNWMTSELLKWKTFDGSYLTGILYKPENFNPIIRYPVIFDYYEKRSNELNRYIEPKASEDRINIAYFVSNGYLVFTPDIHYDRNGPGKSAYNSVVSAAIYLSKMPWVNAKRLGLQGHSFGAYETNFIIAHTNIFAAACSASGFSDLINFYGSPARYGYPMFWAERSQGRLYGTLWERKNIYILNSPIFEADKVSTPLLMMNNKGDETVPFYLGFQFFSALRRLCKKVWMLQYDNGWHSVEGKDALDYHTRLSQFFNHYLKGDLPPKWMTQEIRASEKGVYPGLELDLNGRCGNNCSICNKLHGQTAQRRKSLVAE